MTTLAIKVHFDVFCKLSGVLQPFVSGSTVGHEPSHFSRFTSRIVPTDVSIVVGDPIIRILHKLLVWSDNVRVVPVRSSPVEKSGHLGERLSVQWTFKEKKEPYLKEILRLAIALYRKSIYRQVNWERSNVINTSQK